MGKSWKVTSVLAGLFFLGGGGASEQMTAAPTQDGTVIIAGSTTVAPVAQALADAFVSAFPQYTVEVQSMGTGAGMTSAIEGMADIGLASRHLNADELTHLDFVTFAIDGIAVVVN